jgi:hypothetical protein
MAKKNKTKEFFSNSDLLDYMVLRPLSHINMSWELTWNRFENEYVRGPGTFASLLNDLITEIAFTIPPSKYHNNEDCLAEYVKESLKWNIKKENGKWLGSSYGAILEQGGFKDLNEQNLVQAATGRIKAAIARGQKHFDDMEESHKKMLADVMTIIIYHRQSRL